MAGETDKARGRIKKAVGELTGDKKMKRDGTIDKISGNLKSAVEKVKNVLQGKK